MTAITAWRIDKRKHLREAFSGEGARLFGGRWNHKGTPMIYASESLALAALEKFVHLRAAARRSRFVATEITIPSALVETLPRRRLPRHWSDHRASNGTRDLGTKWAAEMRSAVLKVPSVVITHQFNYLINPLHRDFKRLVIGPPRPFSFDPRMWK